jgi:SAM-dependent methyltransferase
MNGCVRYVLVPLVVCCGWQSDLRGQPTDVPAGVTYERSLPSRYEHVVADMLRFCDPSKGFWVDLGAGRGQVAIPMIEKTGNPMVMVDPDTAAMTEGLKNARQKGLQDKLVAVVGVAEDLPFPDDSVDLLISRGSIFFWDDPARGLQEVYRVLRPGCRAYIGGGAGSGYPADAVQALIKNRKARREGDESEFWQRFVELRRPEQMRQWAEQAGLPDFQVLGRGAISADDPRVGQGVWLFFEKPAKVSTRKEEDSVAVLRQDDATIYSVHSPSGIGGATLPQATPWPEKVILRLYLKGLESLTIGNDALRWHASVTSHGGHSPRLSVKQGDRETEAKADTPYWTKVAAFGADGKPIEGLPNDGGYFELQLPKTLLEASSQPLRLEWIDFYR